MEFLHTKQIPRSTRPAGTRGIDWLIWTTPSDDSWLDETDDAVEIARNIVKCFVSCGTFSSCRWKVELEGEATGALVCDVGARTSIG